MILTYLPAGGSKVKACRQCQQEAEWRYKDGWGVLACADWFSGTYWFKRDPTSKAIMVDVRVTDDQLTVRTHALRFLRFPPKIRHHALLDSSLPSFPRAVSHHRSRSLDFVHAIPYRTLFSSDHREGKRIPMLGKSNRWIQLCENSASTIYRKKRRECRQGSFAFALCL